MSYELYEVKYGLKDGYQNMTGLSQSHHLTRTSVFTRALNKQIFGQLFIGRMTEEKY